MTSKNIDSSYKRKRVSEEKAASILESMTQSQVVTAVAVETNSDKNYTGIYRMSLLLKPISPVILNFRADGTRTWVQNNGTTGTFVDRYQKKKSLFFYDPTIHTIGVSVFDEKEKKYKKPLPVKNDIHSINTRAEGLAWMLWSMKQYVIITLVTQDKNLLSIPCQNLFVFDFLA